MARRLNNSNDVRRYLASLISKVESGEIDSKTADTLTKITNALLIAIRNDTAERELEILESLEEQLKRGTK